MSAPDEPILGMGVSDEALHHVAALLPPLTSEVVLWMHLVHDHEVAPDALAADPRHINETSAMLHMTLHGYVVQFTEDEEPREDH